VKDADAAAFLACLEDATSQELRGSFTETELAGALQSRGADLRNWVVADVQVQAERAWVTVDQQQGARRQRQKFELVCRQSSWRIVRFEPAHELPQDVPYGTHLSDVEAAAAAKVKGNE
jgi:hypothetical protein